MAYKTKICPKCGTEHNKRGEFCSRSCGNSRKQTKTQKQKIGDARSKWLHSGHDEAEVQKHNFVSKGNNKEAEPIPPQIHSGPDIGQFVQDGDLWEEC